MSMLDIFLFVKCMQQHHLAKIEIQFVEIIAAIHEENANETEVLSHIMCKTAYTDNFHFNAIHFFYLFFSAIFFTFLRYAISNPR